RYALRYPPFVRAELSSAQPRLNNLNITLNFYFKFQILFSIRISKSRFARLFLSPQKLVSNVCRVVFCFRKKTGLPKLPLFFVNEGDPVVADN
ncbi:hypothetical protein, partial [Escherichia coli]|uniref:hypothetical protein n=1 Tax=Escherichia coli TaxID=562 RepID=UPI001BD606DD